MSAGASPSLVEVTELPTAKSHSHGRGRGHGHSRSARWAQPPLPSPQEYSNASNSPLSKPLDNEPGSYSYRHASRPSVHAHGHSNSFQSSGHHSNPSTASTIYHDPSHSHAHDHTHSHDHDHHHHNHHHHHEGNPSQSHNHQLQSAMTTQDTPRAKPKLLSETMRGVLLASPWIILSWSARGYGQTNSPEDPSTPFNESLGRVGTMVGMLTAMTMFTFGCGAIVVENIPSSKSSTAASFKFPRLPRASVQVGKLAILQTLSVALPVYAALNVGGFLVAFIHLLIAASGIPGGVRRGYLQQYSKKMFTLAVLGVTVLLSFFGMNKPWGSSPTGGYVALSLSAVVFPPFFPRSILEDPNSEPGLSVQSIAQQDKPQGSGQRSVTPKADGSLAILTGPVLAALTIILSGGKTLSAWELITLMPTAILFALALFIWSPQSLFSRNKIGLAASSSIAALLCCPNKEDDLLFNYAVRAILVLVGFYASKMDDRHLTEGDHSHAHTHPNHHHGHSSAANAEATRVTKWLLRRSEDYPLLHSILKESDSRSIFYFMCLNFTFMLVQLSYGFLTGSLGLLSDSIHMFFDCLALVVGLCAAVMSKWPPNSRFPYGYGKVDTLSGFANGIFLMIISAEIIYEAVERLSSGSQMHRIGELLAVSVAGLLVNLVGIFSFEHGHHHHGHDHGHDHSHGNENMHGIFLHILADTLGSVAVVISTICVHYSGWAGWDPLASCFIAILIFASAVPLVSGTAKSLLLTLPADTEYNIRETLAGVSTLRGVVSYTVPKFWLDDTNSASSSGHDHAHGHGHIHDQSHDHHHHHPHHHDHDHSGHDHSHDHDHDHDHDLGHKHKSQNVLGVIHVIASRGSDLEDVRHRTVDYLREKGMDVVVQVERDGDGRCWCGAGNKSP
ncbi:hypothetical protein N7539_006507 [Penicillium diatomitis]|uniref:Zinc transporter n=1 Tax=Penicillium diatomitis TaxID=2819901 RepID=A0A9W9X3B0_9EURO|nr:uncharacterized protein N7539_006507 [Penicillium diatomitis]KAJ5483061.1 hypothetical protein N7539_006507 [Penicillium diatomitis]